jgi:hypothetical protein
MDSTERQPEPGGRGIERRRRQWLRASDQIEPEKGTRGIGGALGFGERARGSGEHFRAPGNRRIIDTAPIGARARARADSATKTTTVAPDWAERSASYWACQVSPSGPFSFFLFLFSFYLNNRERERINWASKQC